MKNKNKTLNMILLVVTLITLSITTFIFFHKSDFWTFRTKAEDAKVNLSLSPNYTTKRVGEKLLISVFINTNQYKVSGIELVINYNNTALEINPNDIIHNASNFLPVLLSNQKSINNGEIKLILLSQPNSPQKGTGILATFNFKTLTNKNAYVAISNKTKIAVVEKPDVNMLGEIRNSSIAIKYK